MKRRWIQIDGKLIEVTDDYVSEPATPTVFGDLPGYQSPTTGLWVEGRKQRREDLVRSGCRPWEGKEQEVKEAARHKAEIEKRADKTAEKAAWQAWYSLPPDKRRKLMQD